MRSPKAFYGAIALLLVIPTAIISSIAFGDEEAGLHLALAVGAWLLAAAVYDFRVDARINRITGVATALLGAIFMLQAISPLTGNDAFHDFAYVTLGQSLEGLLTTGFVLWCLVMLLSDTSGKTRVFGFVVIPALAMYSVALFVGSIAGQTPPEVLKLLFLPAMLWLALEARRPAASSHLLHLQRRRSSATGNEVARMARPTVSDAEASRV